MSLSHSAHLFNKNIHGLRVAPWGDKAMMKAAAYRLLKFARTYDFPTGFSISGRLGEVKARWLPGEYADYSSWGVKTLYEADTAVAAFEEAINIIDGKRCTPEEDVIAALMVRAYSRWLMDQGLGQPFCPVLISVEEAHILELCCRRVLDELVVYVHEPPKPLRF